MQLEFLGHLDRDLFLTITAIVTIYLPQNPLTAQWGGKVGSGG
jgi:hypothetical protein